VERCGGEEPGTDEGELAQLDADVEGEERQGDLRHWQADFGQGSGKAEAVLDWFIGW
jgi:hypothetical protein